jgi:hypothetical protein
MSLPSEKVDAQSVPLKRPERTEKMIDIPHQDALHGYQPGNCTFNSKLESFT